MQKSISFLLLLFVVSLAYGQVNIGKSKSSFNLYVSSHKQELFNKLKKTKSIFVLPNSVIDKEELKSTIEDLWTFNEITFIDSDSFDVKKSFSEGTLTKDNLVISLIDNVYVKSITGGKMGPETRTVGEYIIFKFIAAKLNDIKIDKKGKTKYDTTIIAEIFFTPNIRLRQDVAYGGGSKTAIGNFDAINKKYGEEPGFYNFDLGYIKNYFQELNRRLVNSENLKIEDGVEKKNKISSLKGKTLYAPEWILMKYHALGATYGKTRTKEELFRKYDFKYQIISNDEINSKILKGDDFYYLMHTQFNQKRILSVIHSITGEIIYLDEDGAYNIKDSDLKKLSKLVG